MSVVSKHVVNGSDEDQNECVDWKLPLSFVKKRHLEPIEGVKEITQTWRMKERVIKFIFSDNKRDLCV